MNACIRAVVRTAMARSIEVVGVMRGFEGLISGEFTPMNSGSVSNIIQRGGTILHTARSEHFKTSEGMQQALESTRSAGIEGVITIGGDGTFKGAEEFGSLSGLPIIGVPGTIDNDLYGTDFTIGYDTAINTVVQAIDKIRDTAESHNRLFFVEVMGRDAGFIALRSGISVGADAILIPETETHIEDLISLLERGWKRKKSSSIIIVAEGDDAGGAFEVARKVKEKFDHYDTRVSVLGHLQRGGSPTAMDRVLASSLGLAAVDALIEGRKGEMVGIVDKKIVYTPFSKAIKHNRVINPRLLRLAEVLST